MMSSYYGDDLKTMEFHTWMIPRSVPVTRTGRFGWARTHQTGDLASLLGIEHEIGGAVD